jgi:hypothetical protein
VLRIPAAPALARRGKSLVQASGGAYSDVKPILHTHSGSSRRAFVDTSLQCGRACTDWIPTPSGGRAYRLEIVRSQIESGSFVRLHRSMNLRRTVARRGRVKCTLRAATHRFFSFLSSPILLGSDCSAVPSARLQDGAADEECPMRASTPADLRRSVPSCKW